jgi:hypothetical protein
MLPAIFPCYIFIATLTDLFISFAIPFDQDTPPLNIDPAQTEDHADVERSVLFA